MIPWNDACFIIAEAGVNHNGDPALALELVDAAAAAGCDAVKFQTFRAADLAVREARMAAYQIENTAREESQADMLARLELDEDTHRALQDRAKRLGIAFFSTAFDPASVTLLASLDVPVWKIPSGEITNLPYLRRIAGLGKPVILSTGMSTLAEVAIALDALLEEGLARDRVAVLHCTTDYPASPNDVNLRAMMTMGNALGVGFGYSDHTSGSEIACAAVALGARVIEKHLTLDCALPGPDHKASLEPRQLTDMVRQIRNIEAALGDGIKRPTDSELGNRALARKSVVAACTIHRGELFSEANLAVKRPATGISPMEWDRLVGRPAGRDFAPDEAIEW